ncbi:MAG: hypothetical protein SGPRY_005835 [Prymnesium sp.]
MRLPLSCSSAVFTEGGELQPLRVGLQPRAEESWHADSTSKAAVEKRAKAILAQLHVIPSYVLDESNGRASAHKTSGRLRPHELRRARPSRPLSTGSPHRGQGQGRAMEVSADRPQFVWNGPKARLRHTLVPKQSEALPDFFLASNRSLNTAVRLGLYSLPQRPQSKRAPRMQPSHALSPSPADSLNDNVRPAARNVLGSSSPRAPVSDNSCTASSDTKAALPQLDYSIDSSMSLLRDELKASGSWMDTDFPPSDDLRPHVDCSQETTSVHNIPPSGLVDELSANVFDGSCQVSLSQGRVVDSLLASSIREGPRECVTSSARGGSRRKCTSRTSNRARSSYTAEGFRGSRCMPDPPMFANEDWLAADQRDFMDVMNGKMRQAQQYVMHHGPQEVAAAKESLESTWRKQSSREYKLTLPLLQQMVSPVSIEEITGPPLAFNGKPIPRIGSWSCSQETEYVSMGVGGDSVK